MAQIGMDYCRGIGMKRAAQHDSLSNLVYNMDRYTYLNRSAEKSGAADRKTATFAAVIELRRLPESKISLCRPARRPLRKKTGNKSPTTEPTLKNRAFGGALYESTRIIRPRCLYSCHAGSFFAECAKG